MGKNFCPRNQIGIFREILLIKPSKDKSLLSVSEALEPLANKINSNLRSTLESACIQNIVINYIQAVFNQVEAKKLKSTDVVFPPQRLYN